MRVTLPGRSSFIIFLLVISLFFQNCNNSTNQEILYPDLSMNDHGVISFDLKDVIPNQPQQLQLVTNSVREYIYIENKYQNGLTSFEVSTQQEDTTIVFPREGAQAVRNMQGFWVHNPDSIFITGSNYQLYLYNTLTGLTDRYPMNDPRNGNASLGVLTLFRDGHFDGEKMSMVGMPYQKPIQNGRLNIDVFLETGEVRENYGYPKALKTDDWSLVQWIGVHRSRTHDGKWLYSFTQSDDLYLTDHSSEGTLFPAPTRLSSSPEPPPAKILALDRKGEKYQQMTTSYFDVIYDPYREVYYRMVSHPVPGITVDNMFQYHFDDKPLSIILLDKSLKIIGEYALPVHTYSANWFVSQRGLCLSLENQYNTKYGSEDNLDFHCISFTVE
jgi:hypothetical protein